MEITGSPDVFPGSIKTPLPRTHNRILPTSLTFCWTFFFLNLLYIFLVFIPFHSQYHLDSSPSFLLRVRVGVWSVLN